jgi:hypothetical protein
MPGFKENDFLNNNPTWNVSYPGDELNIENVPFDVNYVIDICNQRGQFLNSEQDSYKMIAQSLFPDGVKSDCELIMTA